MSGKLKNILFAIAGVSLTSAAVAHEVSLNDVTDYYVKKASTNTSSELQNAAYADVLNTTHKVQLHESEIETRVLISATQNQSDEKTVLVSE